MSIKKVVIFVLLLGVTIVGGRVLGEYCHRFPTEEEMSEYHASHFSTKLVKLESQEVSKPDGTECILFTGLHKPSGIDEVYHVEAGRRWVLPWQQYNWKTEKVGGDE